MLRFNNRPASVAATLATVVLSLTFGLGACGADHPRAAPTTPPPTSTPTTETPPDTGPYDWTRDASPALDLGGGSSSTLGAVVPPAGRAPWLVAGSKLTGEGGSTATVWTSADGTAWTATALTGPQVDSQADAATTWRNDTVIVGSLGPATDRRAAVWISAGPGLPFAEVASDELPTGDSVMTSVTGGPLGLFAAGTASGHLAMWYSNNGRRWNSLSGADRVIGEATDPHIDALVATESGVFAGGWERDGASMAAAVWSSSDGVNWHPVLSAEDAFSGPGDHLITALAPLTTALTPLGAGLVAVGGTWTGTRWSPASWISPNGASWSQASTAFALGGRPQPDATDGIVRALTALPTTSRSPMLVALGGGPTAQRVWRSQDGLHWVEVPLPTGAAGSDAWHASLLAVAGPTMVIADSDPAQPHLLVQRSGHWFEPSAIPVAFGTVRPVARPAGLAATPAGLTLAVTVDHPGQALGTASSSTELLSSADGTSWTPTASGAVFAGGTISGLVDAPAGLIAVGWQQIPGGRRAVAWTRSAAGVWGAGVALDIEAPRASDQASAVCLTGDVVVAVGRVDSVRGVPVARSWVSRNGLHWTLAPVLPASRAGTASVMTGCSSGPSAAGASDTAGTSDAADTADTTAPSAPLPRSPGFDAFGSTAPPGANLVPAFWSSATGSAWRNRATSPFGANFPYPTVDLAQGGGLWLATAGTPDLDLRWPGSDAPDAGSPAAPGASTLWRSTDSGAIWRPLDTSGPLWQGNQPAHIDQVALLGSIPVVAGQIDGQLAVWLGIPN